MSTKPVLIVEDLCVALGRGEDAVAPVEHVSLTVGQGETLGLVGESGCGKSLTLRAIAGLLPRGGLATGTFRLGLDGREPEVYEPPKLRGRGIAMIFQEPMTALNPTMRVGDLVAEPMRVRGAGRVAARRRAIDLMGQVGIPDAAHRARAWPHEFSGGLRQRVMIAAALATDPQLLLCDEPTTALDTMVQEQILELIAALKRERHLSVVFVTHDLAVVAQLSERLAVMYAGQIVETGVTGDVLQTPGHPYTEALLRSAPSIEQRVGRLSGIPGRPPDPRAFPTGCRFADRCKYAQADCRTGNPSLTPLEPSRFGDLHSSACLHPEVLAVGRAGGAARARDPVVVESVGDAGGRGSRQASVVAVGFAAGADESVPEKPPYSSGVELRGAVVRFPVESALEARLRGRDRLQVTALAGVDLVVRPGEALGLVGESGCGKSTLARVLVGLVPLSEGTLAIDGQVTGVKRSRPLRRHIQMVFQDPSSSLNPARTVGQMLGELLRAHDLVPSSGIDARCRELLELVQLPSSVMKVRPRQLSGGQRQRVGIARALALEPKVLIADEAVAALDVSVQATILNLLSDLRRQLGLTLIFISHDLSVVRHISDELAVMYLGRIVEKGSADAVFRHPRHPYTRALLAASPQIAARGQLDQLTVPGEPPSPIHLPKGCRFAPRCPIRQGRCEQEDPALTGPPDHQAACFFQELAVAGSRQAGATRVEARP